MRCRAVVCAECVTRIDGVNHCHACLRSLARPPARPQRRSAGGVLGSLLVLALVWSLLFGAGWLARGVLAP